MEGRHAVFSALIERNSQVRAALEAALGELREYGVRSDLDEGASAGGVHGFDFFDEAHGLRDGIGELLTNRGHVARIHGRRGVRVVRELRGRHFDAVQIGTERSHRASHDRRVEGRGDREALGRQAIQFQVVFGLLDVLDRARKHDLFWRVVVGEHDVHAFEGFGDDVAFRSDCRHGSGELRRFGHELATHARDAKSGLLVEETRSHGCRDLTERVSGDHRRVKPRELEQTEHSEARRGDRGLGPLGRRELRFGFGACILAEARARKHARSQAPRGVADVRRHAVPHVAHAVEVHGEVRAHVHVLAALAREEHGHFRGFGRGTHAIMDALRRGKRSRAVLFDRAGGESELLSEVRFARGHDGETRGFVGDETELGLFGEVRQRALDFRGFRGFIAECNERRGRVGREDQELRRLRAHAARALRRAYVFFEGDVEVRSAEPESAHRGATRIGLFRIVNPRAALGVEVKGAVLESHLRVGRVHLDGGRKHLVVQRQDGFDHSGRAGGGLGVADLALHRAESDRVFGGAGLAEHDLQRFELGGVAGLRAGSVGFDEAHGLGAVACALVGATKGEGLTLSRRRINALRASVRRRAKTANDRVDGVAVALCVVQATKGQHANALAEHGAVRLVREGTAIAPEGQRARLGEAHVHEDVVQGVDTAGEHEVRVSKGEVVHGHRDGGERTGARGVDHGVRAAHVEPVGDASGDHVSEEPGERGLLPRDVVFIDFGRKTGNFLVRETRLAHGVLPHGLLQATGHLGHELGGRSHAEKDAHAAAIDTVPLAAGGFVKRVLGHDEREKLRRVGGGQRVRGHAELDRGKVHLGQEAAARGVDLVLRAGFFREIVVPKPVGAGHLGQPILALHDVLPEGEGVLGPGKQGTEAHDGNGGHQGGGLLGGLHVGMGTACRREKRRNPWR